MTVSTLSIYLDSECLYSSQTRNIDTMWAQVWASVANDVMVQY